MSEVEKMYENVGVKPEYRYNCNLADTIKPIEVFRLSNCSKGEIKDFCTNKQYYRYCKVYKVNKIFPPFTAEKQLELIKWLCQNTYRNYIHIRYERDINNWKIECNMVGIREFGNFDECFAGLINNLWQDLTEQERTEIRGILK